MKNKLLVCVCSLALVAFGLTSCEPERGNVTDVCTDMLKETMHKSARSLDQLDGQKLRISEYEFLGGVNDNRLVRRTILFGNGAGEDKKVDSLTYEYGEWLDQNTAFTLLVTPREGEPYTLIYKGDAFRDPEGLMYSVPELPVVAARVEKWESVINSLPNSAWEVNYKGEYVLDSVFRDSVKIVPVPFPHEVIIKVFDHMDTVSADTTCLIRYEFRRDLATKVNTGRLIRNGVRSHYDRQTKQTIVDKETEWEANFEWYFPDVSSDKKFTISTISKTAGVDNENLKVTGYKIDEKGKGVQLTLGGLTYKAAVLP